MRDVYFGNVRYVLRLRVEVRYEVKHPEKGGWLSGVELEMFGDGGPWELPENMSSPYVKHAFMKALEASLQWCTA